MAASSAGRPDRPSARTTACSGGFATKGPRPARDRPAAARHRRDAPPPRRLPALARGDRGAAARRSCRTSWRRRTARVRLRPASSGSARRCGRRSSSPGRASSSSRSPGRSSCPSPTRRPSPSSADSPTRPGSALEQVERRRAEADAARRADATRRLQEVTAALSRRYDRPRREQHLSREGARVRRRGGGLRRAHGPGRARRRSRSSRARATTTTSSETWRARDLDSDVPFARAIAAGEPVWALSGGDVGVHGVREARAADGSPPARDARGRPRGASSLLPSPRDVHEEDRAWLQSMVSQCGWRSSEAHLFEDERRSRGPRRAAPGHHGAARERVDVDRRCECGRRRGRRGRRRDRSRRWRLPRTATCQRILAARGNGDGRRRSWCSSRGSHRRAPSAARTSHAQVGAARRRPGSLGSPDEVDMLARSAPRCSCSSRSTAGRRSNGLLVAAWDSPVLLSKDDRAMVEALAGQAGLGARPRRQFEAEQTIAETLQRSVLPARFHGSTASSSRPATCPGAATSTSAATGSTCSSSPTGSSASSSATSSARACRPRRAWRSYGTRSAHSRSTD